MSDNFISVSDKGVLKFDIKKRYIGMPLQHEFIKDNSEHSYLWGGFGNGKSDCLVIKALKYAFKHPKALGLIGRATKPELRDSTMRSFFDICPSELIKSYNQQTGELKLANGAEILCKAFDKPHKVKSMNLGWACFDQLEDIPKDIWLQFLGRLRSVHCKHMFGVGNPEANWVKETIRDNPDYSIYEAATDTNPHLPKGYVESLKKQYPEHWIKRYIYGSWDHFEGQILSCFIRDKHVIDPFDIPPTWEVKAEYIIDYGYRNPTAVLKFIRDFDGNHYIVDEHYERDQVITYHRKKMYEMGYNIKRKSLIDPSCGAKNRTKNEKQISIIDEYKDTDYQYPVNPQKANNNISGLMRANQWFKANRLFIFRNCTNTIREVENLRWKQVKPGYENNMPEEEEDRNNHTTDNIKYYVNSRPRELEMPIDKHNPNRKRYEKLTKGPSRRVY